jgi:hypothetical protein
MKIPSTTKLGKLRMFPTMVILAVFLLLSTYICSAPPSMPGGQKWRSNTFSPALKLSLLPHPQRGIFGAGCWHSTTPHTTTSTDHLRPRKGVRTKSPRPSPLIMPTIRNDAVPPTTATSGDVLPGIGGPQTSSQTKRRRMILSPRSRLGRSPSFPPLAHAPSMRAVFPAWRPPKPC